MFLEQKDNLEDNPDLNMIFSTVQIQKSFYNKSVRKMSKPFFTENYSSTNNNETIYENTATMDLTSKSYYLYKYNINCVLKYLFLKIF